MKIKASLVKLSADGLPTEFRIFFKGWNRTSKGNFLYDEIAAKAVKAEYDRHGVEMMIDLEHLSLDSESKSYDPDAYGWCKLDFRADGSLWAVNVRWTEEGARRLQKRTQRYISPAFMVSNDTGRVTSIYNIAICAVPATYETPALVAASARVNKKICAAALEVRTMDIQKVLDALGLPEGSTLEDILAAIAAMQASTATDDPEKEEASDDCDDEDPAKEASDDVEASDEISPEAIASLPAKLQAQILAQSVGYKKLSSDVAKLKTDQRKDQIDRLIKANTDKIPPRLEKWARKQTPEVLSEFLSVATPIKAHAQPPREDGDGDPKNVGGKDGFTKAQLDAFERVAALTGKTKEKLIEAAKADREKTKKRMELING